jgi:hypothetical protein
LVEDAFSRKARVDSRLEKQFFADKEYRKQNDSQARKFFVNLRYSSAEITFSPDQKERLQVFIDRIANSSNRSGRKGGTYYDGRCGTPISKNDLIGLDCDVLETILRVFDRVEEVAADAARKEKANAKRLAQESADKKKQKGKRLAQESADAKSRRERDTRAAALLATAAAGEATWLGVRGACRGGEMRVQGSCPAATASAVSPPSPRQPRRPAGRRGRGRWGRRGWVGGGGGPGLRRTDSWAGSRRTAARSFFALPRR